MDALQIALTILAACVVLLFLAPPPLAADGADVADDADHARHTGAPTCATR